MHQPGSSDLHNPGPGADAENWLHSTPLAAISLDRDGSVRGFTSTASRIYQVDASTIGRPLSHLAHHLIEPPPMPALSELEARGEPIDDEVQCEDGRWFLRHVLPCKNADGLLDGMVVSFTDVTKIRQREAALRRSEEELRLALEAARRGEARFRFVAENAPGLIWMSSAERGLEFVNQAYLDFFGKRLDEVLGFGFMPSAHPEDAKEFFAVYLKAVKSRSPFTAEARFRRADGAYRWLLSQGVPLRDDHGAGLGYIGSSLDVTGIKRAEADLRDSAERLRIALEASRMGDWIWDTASDLVTLSPRATEILGLQNGHPGSWSDLQALLQPDDARRVAAGVAAAIAARDGYDVEYRLKRPSDGTDVWIAAKGQPAYGPDGSLQGMVGVVQDVTERKFAEERQTLLIRELHHRVKNTLATVQAIVGSTARTASTIDEFYQAFVGRIVSLAKTHTLLTEHQWQTASLAQLLHHELGPFDDGQEGRVTVEGPMVELTSEAAVPIGMAVHELTTNAAKHGALSGAGRVDVRWTLEAEGDVQMLRFTWTERGGPRIGLPERHGFGSRLLQRVLATQLQADVHMDFDEQGLTFTMAMPVRKPADPYTSLKPV